MKNRTLLLLAIPALLTGTAASAQSTTSQVVTTFAAGTEPVSALVQASDGNLYGVTNSGGTAASGSIYQLTPNGTLTTIYSFQDGADGGYPSAGVIEGPDGALYGTTTLGGANGLGTVFRLTASGLTTLHSFDPDVDGNSPYAALTLASDGNLYGVLAQGAYDSTSGAYAGGTIFQVTTSGGYQDLYSFPENGSAGSLPTARMIQATDGNLWGSTSEGGANGYGTLFYWSPSSGLQVVYSLTQFDGQCLYGLAQFGSYLFGVTFPAGLGNGEVFGINLSNHAFNPVYAFSGGTADGGSPSSSLLQYTDGQLYGTTQAGGANGAGTFFRLNASGQPQTLLNLPAGTVNTLYDASLVETMTGQLLLPILYDSTPGLTQLDGAGEIWQVLPGESSPVAAPVQFAASANSLTVGQSVTLTWSTPNISSLSGKQCYASSSPATPWSGAEPASGSLTGPLNNAGTFTFALTCGGTVSSVVQVNVLYATQSSLSAPTMVVRGATATLSATVSNVAAGGSAPTGTVLFLVNGSYHLATVNVASGTATYTAATSSVAPGTYSVQAVYSGDATHAASTSSAKNVTVQPNSTTTSLSTSATTVTEGQQVTLTATVTASSGTPSGTVSFLYGSYLVGTATLNNGTAVLTASSANVPHATYPIHASYAGSGVYQGSSSSNVSITVN